MPFIIGANSAVGGLLVENSCRFDRASSAYMSKTQGAGNRRKATFSTWVKGAYPGAYDEQMFMSSGGDHNCYGAGASTGTFRINTGTGDYAYSTAYHRDPSAWYHMVWAVDTEQAVAADRMKLYINGTQVTSFSASSYPSEDEDLDMNQTGETFYISKSAGTSYGNYYLAETVWIDGLQLAPTSFGEFNEDSPTIWQPIDVSGLTFGTNGFYLDYKDSANLGNDANGGTDLTESGLAATDQTTDTPVNNFSTLNPLQAPYPAQPNDMSNGNTSIQGNYGDWQRVYGTIGVKLGKWFYEWKCTAIDSYNNRVGWDSIDFINDGADNYYSGLTLDGDGKLRGGISGVSAYDPDAVQMTAAHSGGNFSFTTSDILGMALDRDNNTISIYKNGNLEIDAYSFASASDCSILLSKGYFVAPSVNFFSASSDINTSTFNFGNPPYAITSSNADADGYGNFEYAVPSGYYALCTKNLGAYGG